MSGEDGGVDETPGPGCVGAHVEHGRDEQEGGVVLRAIENGNQDCVGAHVERGRDEQEDGEVLREIENENREGADRAGSDVDARGRRETKKVDLDIWENHSRATQFQIAAGYEVCGPSSSDPLLLHDIY